MTTPDQLPLDPSTYLQALGQAQQSTDGFTGSVRNATTTVMPFQRALNMITPSRALLGGMGALAAGAANVQAQLSGLAARATVTHASMAQLTSGMQSLARSFPIGNDGARALMQGLSQLGVVTRGSEGQVKALARTFVQLSGATGEGAGGLAGGFIQLNRAMGTGLDPVRMGKLADSLTTVSAQSGASATSILAFSKAIAPMANASGIGETKVLGISAAFSKLGEDGFGAANAFNKMLGDLNRSVRDGSPMLATYASIVGKTASQFQNLYKANPAEAMTQVVESLSKGAQGQRGLEQLGLDGVRVQRYLQELSQSGGLRSAIATSVGAYGSGSTTKAAQAAFDTLASAGQKAAANASQLGEALGAPLLRPLTMFTNAIGAAITPFRSLAGSRGGQDVLNVAAYGTAAAAVLLKILPKLGILQLGTSGPVRSLLGGAAVGLAQGDAAAAQRNFFGRIGGGRAAEMIGRSAPLGRGYMGRVNQAFSEIGGTAGLLLRAQRPAEGPGLLSLARYYGTVGVAGGLRTMSEQARLARLPFEERQMSLLGPRLAAERKTYTGRREEIAKAEQEGFLTRQEANAARATARGEMVTALGGSRGAGRAVLRAGAGLFGQTALTTGSLALRGGGALLGALGMNPMMLGLGAGFMGYQAWRGGQQRDQAYASGIKSGAFNVLDEYNVAMGKATTATDTFAGKMQAAADSLTKATSTVGQAVSLKPEDVKRSQQIADQAQKQLHHFTGSDAGIAGQITSAIGAGASPDVIQQMRTDLLKQYKNDPGRVARILSQVNVGATGNTNYGPSIEARISGVAGYRQKRFGFISEEKHQVEDTSGMGVDYLTKGQKDTTAEVATEIGGRYAQRYQQGGKAFAGGQARNEMDRAVDAAFKKGNFQLAQSMERAIEAQVGVARDRISEKDVNKAGGFGEYLAQRYKGFADTYGAAGTAGGRAQSQTAYETSVLGNYGLGQLFTSGGGKAGGLVRSLMATPGNLALQAQAPLAVAQQVGGGAQGLAQLAAAAGAAAAKLGDVEGGAGDFLIALHNMAQQMAMVRGATGTTGSQLQLQAGMAAADAAIKPTNAATSAIQAKGVSDLQSIYVQTVNMAKQRLAAQREFQISSERSNEDYNRSKLYADQDYYRQTSRAEADQAKNVRRQTQDYHKDLYRSERDFGISMVQATQDYNKGRFRTIRDFNKSIAREIEDSARSLMDPYKRIATEPIWDTGTLLMNMKQQNDAISKQLLNLAQLRKSGVSDQVIKLLGLNDPNNAQQLASMIGDLTNDPALVAKLNATASSRNTVASALVGDPANTALQRQKQDLKTGLNDMLADFTISTKRARDAFRRQRTDASHDFALAMVRESIDYHTALSRAAQDRATAMDRMAAQYSVTVGRMRADMLRADTEVTGDLSALSTALNRAIHGQSVNFTKLTANSMATTLALLGDYITKYRQWISGMGATITVTPVQLADPVRVRPGGLAEGGIATRRTTREIAEQSPEMVLPLDHRGTRFLSALMGRLSNAEVSGMAPAMAASAVHYHADTYSYDHSNRIEGPVTVVSQDPDEMLRKISAKKSRDNMTALRPAGTR